MSLLNIGNNAKTVKGDAKGEYLTAVLYLAPAKTSGYQVCPSATEGCRAACLFTAGRGQMPKIQEARVKKTVNFFENKEYVISEIYKEMKAFEKKCVIIDRKPAVRLNGTSDINWAEIAPEFFKDFPNIKFYDYVKIEKTMTKYIDKKLPSNYHLTFSRSELNWDFCLNVLQKNHNVAAVFEKIPNKYNGFSVINGDEDDLRFLNPSGVIIGLKAKGKARNDKSGFVIRDVEID